MSLNERRIRDEAQGSEGCSLREGGSYNPLIILQKLQTLSLQKDRFVVFHTDAEDSELRGAAVWLIPPR